jgi:ribosomal protein S18 acetylase RimI-like enzyme
MLTREHKRIDVICSVAEVNESIAGFVIYSLARDHIHLLRIAVSRQWRSKGVGSAMVDRLISKLQPGRRNRIVLQVNEENLESQMFFRHCGFLARSVLTKTGRTVYCFAHSIHSEQNVTRSESQTSPAAPASK